MYRVGFPIKRPWVLGDRVLPTPVWDTSELVWNTYDDFETVVTVLELHPHPDICIVYEYSDDGSRTRLHT